MYVSKQPKHNCHNQPGSCTLNMDSNIRLRIPAILSEHRPDLAWSLKPFIYSFRMMGIDLDVWSPRSKFKRYASSIIAIIMMISLMICFAKVTVSFKYLTGKQRMNTEEWIESISFFLWSSSSFTILLIIFFRVLFKWKELWQKVDQMDRIFALSRTFFTLKHVEYTSFQLYWPSQGYSS